MSLDIVLLMPACFAAGGLFALALCLYHHAQDWRARRQQAGERRQRRFS